MYEEDTTVSDAGRLPDGKTPRFKLPASPSCVKAGQKLNAAKSISPVPALTLTDFVDTLAELQVRRKFYINTTNRQANAAKALVRRGLGWRSDAEEASREALNKRAGRIVDAALKGKTQKREDEELFGALMFDLEVISQSISPAAEARKQVELEMKRTVRKLPVYVWAKSVHGLGELGLAVIIGEAGDLSKYPKKGHLWKRLGLAPYAGKAMSTHRREGGLSSEEWTKAGYNPTRRAEIYSCVSEPMFRQQSVVSGPYRILYDNRREKTSAEHEDWSKMRSHMDALRIMTKAVVKDLWQEWKAFDAGVYCAQPIDSGSKSILGR